MEVSRLGFTGLQSTSHPHLILPLPLEHISVVYLVVQYNVINNLYNKTSVRKHSIMAEVAQ